MLTWSIIARAVRTLSGPILVARTGPTGSVCCALWTGYGAATTCTSVELAHFLTGRVGTVARPEALRARARPTVIGYGVSCTCAIASTHWTAPSECACVSELRFRDISTASTGTTRPQGEQPTRIHDLGKKRLRHPSRGTALAQRCNNARSPEHFPHER